MRSQTLAALTLMTTATAGAAACGGGTTTSSSGHGGSSATASSTGSGGGGGPSASAGSGGTSSSSGTGGSGVDCSQDPLTHPEVITDACGVFVSATASKTGEDGTSAHPHSMFYVGLDEATQNNRILFVCAEDYTEVATYAVLHSVRIYGNLTGCAAGADTWAMADAAQDANRAKVNGPADQLSLVIQQATTTATFYGIDLIAPSAQKPADGTSYQGSSVVMFADTGATATFTHCTLTAGDAMPGAAGADAPTPMPGTKGNAGGKECAGTVVPGGAQVTTACTADMSVGGAGGNGEVATGDMGSPGLPGTTGKAGMANKVCSAGGNGGDGSTGNDGTAGIGAAATFGLFDNGELAPPPGKSGHDGTVGQGGGGGGGQTGSGACGGASGGSGGSGGCAGGGGGAGKGGGSSIVALSNQANLSFVGCTMSVGTPGAGGRGGNAPKGASGAAGGAGGTVTGSSLQPGCAGGTGGDGGAGGPGGGGRGGYSIAIAYSGTLPVHTATGLSFAGTAAAGGKGGNANVPATGKGVDGISTKCWDIEHNVDGGC
jgi:hypothetical protein